MKRTHFGEFVCLWMDCTSESKLFLRRDAVACFNCSWNDLVGLDVDSFNSLKVFTPTEQFESAIPEMA